MKIVVSDCDHAHFEPETKVFAEAGLEWKLLQCKTEDDLIREGKGVNIFITQYAPFTRRVIETLSPDIKQVIRYGVGYNTVDTVAAEEFGVQVCNVPDYSTHEVSDHTLALMMALTRKVLHTNNLVKSGTWDYTKSIPIYRLAEQTVSVIGFGRNGRMFAQKVSAIGCKVLAYDPWYKPQPGDEGLATMVPLETAIREADILVMACPLTDGTRDIISDAAFNMMKPSAYLVNTARGGVVNEAALDRALTAGKIAGAGVDVGEVEPIPMSSPLYRHDNCIITPHLAWYSEASSLELKRKVAEEAVRLSRGEKVHYPVNTPKKR